MHTLVFIINPLSGSRLGLTLLDEIAESSDPHIHGFNILDLAEGCQNTTEGLLRVLKSGNSPRVCVGGGDGTLKWVIEILTPLMETLPPLSPMSLGTGNELGFVSGWGNEFSWTLSKYCKLARLGQIHPMDTWNTSVSDLNNNNNPQTNSQSGPQVNLQNDQQKNDDNAIGKCMTSFFSCGLDAEIGFKYHKQRQTEFMDPVKRTSRKSLAGVKAKHAFWGIQSLFGKGRDISQALRLHADGKEVMLPKGIQNIMVFNIHTSAGHAFHWGNGKSGSKDTLKDHSAIKVNDGLLEVAALRSLTHSIATRVKLSHARRLAQAKTIEIEFLESIVAQIDGEPWVQEPGSSIKFTRAEQIQLVCGPNKLFKF